MTITRREANTSPIKVNGLSQREGSPISENDFASGVEHSLDNAVDRTDTRGVT